MTCFWCIQTKSELVEKQMKVALKDASSIDLISYGVLGKDEKVNSIKCLSVFIKK